MASARKTGQSHFLRIIKNLKSTYNDTKIKLPKQVLLLRTTGCVGSCKCDSQHMIHILLPVFGRFYLDGLFRHLDSRNPKRNIGKRCTRTKGGFLGATSLGIQPYK